METAAIVALSTLAGGVISTIIAPAVKNWFTSKKEDAETMKMLTENEKLSFEARTLIEKTVEERDRNINLKIKEFQKELLESAEQNYLMKKQLLSVQAQLDKAEQQRAEVKAELDKEMEIRMTCVNRLNEIERLYADMQQQVNWMKRENSQDC